MDGDEPEDWELLPTGTRIDYAHGSTEVLFEFPDTDSAVIFFEFMRSWVAGEVKLEIVKE